MSPDDELVFGGAELMKNKGVTSLTFRKKMAEKNFKLTSDYDLSIFKWFK